jgi:hypothetical protein
MIIGLSFHTFTIVHVAISLIAIVSGLVVVIGMLGAHRLPLWTWLFLVTTILTSFTGFMFPIHGFTPGLGTGAVSIAVLAVAVFALYLKHLTGAWRSTYVTAAVLALYLNVLVLIVQSFQKISLLHALSPTQSEPPFLMAQVGTLVAFVAIGIAAVSRFHPGPAGA